MDIKDFISILKDRKIDLETLMVRRMPAIAGRMAVDHFRDNFRRGGFVDTTLERWIPAKRLSSGGSDAASNYGTLLSRRSHLFRSIRSSAKASRAVVGTRVPYASVHNEGGTLSPAVTPRMRRYAWYRYYKAAGITRKTSAKTRSKKLSMAKENRQALFWKRLALTKKSRMEIKIPKRRFVGPSKVLEDAISAKIESEIMKILNS
ncbi:MAG: phage virion morphogenesis protein [Duncaniella sp.]|nr:phage virion morphogenesis protein [Duncaniella sp.]